MNGSNLERDATLEKTNKKVFCFSEAQITLSGQLPPPNKGGVHPIRERITDQLKSILCIFYCDFSSIGLSIVDLKRMKIAENTARRHIQSFILDNYIHLVAQNVGPNKSMKFYKITEKGALYYESLNKKKDIKRSGV